MAKHAHRAKSRVTKAAIVRYEKPTVVVRAPASAPWHKKAAHHGKHAGRKIATAAWEEKHLLGAALGAGALGMAKRLALPLPGKSIPVLGVKGTCAAIVYGASKFLLPKSRMLRHMATGLVCVWAYDVAAGEGTSGDEDD